MDYKPKIITTSTIVSVWYVFVCVWLVRYILYACGVSPCVCMCLSVPVGVVSVLFDSLIRSLLPLSLLSCLQSPVGSTLLFRLKVRSSARQAGSHISRLF